MSIFPIYSRQDSAEHDGAEPRAQRAAQQHTSNAQAQRPGEAGTAASKPHRFDKIALRLAAGMITAIRVTLGVFSSPDKERWPFERLLGHLRGAETLAREMLREIAEKIFISPGKVRERRDSKSVPPPSALERTPYFRLGVIASEAHRHPGLCEAQDRDLPQQDADVSPEGPPTKSADDDTLNQSSLTRRIAALKDVLAHPGKHGARMARALYRAEHETSGPLTAKSPDDLMIDRINEALAAHLAGDTENVARLHAQVLEAG